MTVVVMVPRPVVLIVDDDGAMRELLSSLFSVDGGFRIGGVAADGLEGAMLAAEVNPDVVVLDYYMPRWNGERTAEFIRKQCPRAKIVAFSAYLGALPKWADAFLLKTDVEQLVGLAEKLAEVR
ncbi:MAG: response regulator transcription factor [Actinomycetota bacterium]|nr:response regulator transcription factor [Actinomycetota bacterium]